MRWMEYEERRKRNVETVLKDLMLANSRTNYRKATSVLNRLTMQHDERMLKTAFKQPGQPNRIMSAAINQRRFGSNARHNVKRSYDLQGGPEEERYKEATDKYDKGLERWNKVLDRKYRETERFCKERKDNLFAKFKKEKIVKERNNEEAEDFKDM